MSRTCDIPVHILVLYMCLHGNCFFQIPFFVCGMHVREDMFPCGVHVRVALVLESNKVIHRLVPIIGVSRRNRANRSLYVIHTLYIL